MHLSTVTFIMAQAHGICCSISTWNVHTHFSEIICDHARIVLLYEMIIFLCAQTSKLYSNTSNWDANPIIDIYYPEMKPGKIFQK